MRSALPEDRTFPEPFAVVTAFATGVVGLGKNIAPINPQYPFHSQQIHSLARETSQTFTGS